MNHSFKDFSSNEFKEFQSIEEMAPPAHLSESIMTHVHQELNPNAWRIFSKISLIHFVMASVTLSVCPQFGFRVFGSGSGLGHVFMSLGSYGCMVACGSFFLGTSVLVGALTLRPEELRQLKRNAFLTVSALTFLSMGFFIMLDSAEILFSFAIAWLLGSMMAGMVLIEVVFAVRMRGSASLQGK